MPLLGQCFDELALSSFVRTTGGKGLHVVVPIARRHSWDEARRFAWAVVERLAAKNPREHLAKSSQAARQNKIFLDYLRNNRGATAVATHSTRARSGSLLKVPLAWDELSPAIRADHVHVHSVPVRLARLNRDPWAELPDIQQLINSSIRRRLGLSDWVA